MFKSLVHMIFIFVSVSALAEDFYQEADLVCEYHYDSSYEIEYIYAKLDSKQLPKEIKYYSPQGEFGDFKKASLDSLIFKHEASNLLINYKVQFSHDLKKSWLIVDYKSSKLLLGVIEMDCHSNPEKFR